MSSCAADRCRFTHISNVAGSLPADHACNGSEFAGAACCAQRGNDAVSAIKKTNRKMPPASAQRGDKGSNFTDGLLGMVREFCCGSGVKARGDFTPDPQQNSHTMPR